MLCMIHLPHVNKKEGISRTVSLIRNENLDNLSNTILIDHNTEETIEETLSQGFWAGLTVYPNTKLSPGRAMNMIEKYGAERIMINSAADWGISDPLSVPLVAREMLKRGFSRKEIENVTCHNAYNFFKQSSNFKWKP